jgi:hypothetical protein
MADEIKRIDLRLRSKYPHLKTTIYKIGINFYVILAENFTGEFDSLSKEFDNEIRFITSPVRLTQIKPERYIEIIPLLEDKNIADSYAGYPYTQQELLDLINYICHDLPVYFVEGVGKDKIKIFTGILTENNRKDLEHFLDELKFLVPFQIIEDLSLAREKVLEHKRIEESLHDNQKYQEFISAYSNPVLNFHPTKNSKGILECEKADEEFWFGNVNKIFKNEITLSDIINFDKSESSCYIDYALFQNINIRNGVLLYDNIFLNLPLEDDCKTYLFERQKITKNELFNLVEKNKVKIVLTQPSYRYDIDFLKELCSINRNAVISRRRVCSIMLMDFIDIYSNYFINQLDMSESIFDLSKIMSAVNKVDFEFIYGMLSWPFSIIRNAFYFFTFNTNKRIGSIGINTVVDKLTSKKSGKDFSLEFMVGSEGVHISHALNAVYYPSFTNEDFSMRPFSSIMGNLLNFYSNSSIEKMSGYVNDRKSFINAKKKIYPVELLEVNDYLSLAEIESFASNYGTPSKLNALLSYFLNFDDEERNIKINEYNQAIDLLMRKKQQNKTFLDLGIAAATDTVGLVIPFFGTGIKILEKALHGIGIIDRARLFKIFNKLEYAFRDSSDKKNISYLTKINTVARLKRQYSIDNTKL